MVVLNHMERFQLALDVLERVPGLGAVSARAAERFTDALRRHKAYVSEHGEDLPEVKNWVWS
jgi:xylulose-5-phosphate/fructose-6-phosphate phosphoketolase